VKSSYKHQFFFTSRYHVAENADIIEKSKEFSGSKADFEAGSRCQIEFGKILQSCKETEGSKNISI